MEDTDSGSFAMRTVFESGKGLIEPDKAGRRFPAYLRI